MTRILICAGDLMIESLLSIVAERMGYETEALRSAPRESPPAGDLLIVDLSAAHGVAWAQALRRLDGNIPVVTVGLEPSDRKALGFAPTAVVPKPFGLDELRSTVAQALPLH